MEANHAGVICNGKDGGDPVNDELRRLIQRLQKIKGNDPISRARKAALLKAIQDLMAEG